MSDGELPQTRSLVSVSHNDWISAASWLNWAQTHETLAFVTSDTLKNASWLCTLSAPYIPPPTYKVWSTCAAPHKEMGSSACFFKYSFTLIFVPSMFYVLINSSGRGQASHKTTSLQRKTHKESSSVSMLLLLFQRSLVLEKGFSCSSMLHTSKSSCTDISLIAHQQECPPYQPDPAQRFFLYLHQ